jgi:benzoate-CoA ligase family protein
METEVAESKNLNVASYFLEHDVIGGKGKRVAIYLKDEKYTYNDIVSLTNKVGNALKELGVEIENRVYIVLNDSLEFVATYYAAIKIGAIPSIGYNFFSPKDFLRELRNIRPKVVVVHAEYLDRLREGVRNSRYPKYIGVVDGSPSRLAPGEIDFGKVIKHASQNLDGEPTHQDDIAIWAFSGGTTGVRKVIPHRHYDLVFAYEAYNQILDYKEDDVILPIPKLFFGYGRTGSILFPFRVGAAAVLFPERATPNIIFQLIKKHNPSILINVPTMMRKMLQVPKEERTDLSRVRLCTSAGEALSADLYNEWKRDFGCEVLDGIGSGEMFYNFTINIPGKVVPGSVGKPLPGYELNILDENGNGVPDGDIGVLAVKGGSAANHYLRDYEKTKKTFRGEWVFTEDLFSKDKDGNFYFFGRKDDLLKVSGYFVSPLEIEECISTYPDIAACAVVGVKDTDGLEKTKAFIILKEGISPSESIADKIREYAKSKLASYKYPRIIEFINELPLTRTDKIDRNGLRRRGA